MVNVLIVEDECICAIDLNNQLQDSGYNVVDIVPFGEDAVIKAFQHKPDIILMDIYLKGKINGIKAAELINNLYNIPIIYITSYVDEKTLKKAKATNPSAFIIKPFEIKEILMAIDLALQKHHTNIKLNEDKEKFKLLYQKAPLAYQSLDKNGNILDVNETWINFMGYSYEEVINQPFSKFISRKDRYKFIKYYENLDDEEISKIELQLIKKDNSYLVAKNEFKLIKNKNGDLSKTHCILYKTTKQKINETQIEEITENTSSKFPIENEKITSQKIDEKNFALVDFKGYVENLVKDILHSYNITPDLISINLKIENIMLDMETSLLFGLIINELVKSILEETISNVKSEISINLNLISGKFILSISNEIIKSSEGLLHYNLKLANTLEKQLGGEIKIYIENSEFKVII